MPSPTTFPDHSHPPLPPSSSLSLTSPVSPFPSGASSSSGRPLPLATIAATTVVANVALLSVHHPRPIDVLLRPDRALTTAVPSSSRVPSSPGFSSPLPATTLPPAGALPSCLRSSSPSRVVDPLSLPHFPDFSLSSMCLFLSQPPSSSPSRPLPLVGAATVVAYIALLSDHRPRPIVVLLRPDRALTTAVPSSS